MRKALLGVLFCALLIGCDPLKLNFSPITIVLPGARVYVGYNSVTETKTTSTAKALPVGKHKTNLLGSGGKADE